jgi:hypothetical protein
MNAYLAWFYRWMLRFMRYDHAIAKGTGRNPALVSAMRVDITEMETYVLRLEANA